MGRLKTSDLDPEGFHKEIEKRMKSLAGERPTRPVEVGYKNYEIRAFPKFDKIAAQIDKYHINRYFDSVQEAIQNAKDQIDKWDKEE